MGTSAGCPSFGVPVENLGYDAPGAASGGIAAVAFTRNDEGARIITVGADPAGTIQVKPLLLVAVRHLSSNLLVAVRHLSSNFL